MIIITRTYNGIFIALQDILYLLPKGCLYTQEYKRINSFIIPQNFIFNKIFITQDIVTLPKSVISVCHLIVYSFKNRY